MGGVDDGRWRAGRCQIRDGADAAVLGFGQARKRQAVVYTATLLIFYFLFFLVPSFSSCLEKKVSSIILSLIFYFLFHFLYSYDF